MSDVSSYKGARNQSEIFTWYLSIVGDPTRSPSAESEVFRNIRRRLLQVHGLGWRLVMTGENSPADRAGIDFIWENGFDTWFPLDCTSMHKTTTPRLISTILVVNAPSCDGGGVLTQSKIAFAEQLIRLTEQQPILRHSTLSYPSIKPTRNQLPELKKFQQGLLKNSSGPSGELYREWAERLRKSIGFSLLSERKSSLNIRQLVTTSIQAGVRVYLDSVLGTAKLQPLKATWLRNHHVSFSVSADTLYVSDSSQNVLGLVGMISREFDAQYFQYLKGATTAAQRDELMQGKRNFAGKGLPSVIHFVLDVVEAKSHV